MILVKVITTCRLSFYSDPENCISITSNATIVEGSDRAMLLVDDTIGIYNMGSFHKVTNKLFHYEMLKKNS